MAEYTLEKKGDIYYARLLPSPWSSLWDGSKYASGDRLPTPEDLQHVIDHGTLLRDALADTGKILFVSWFPVAICHEVIRKIYEVEAMVPRKSGREYTLSHLFQRPLTPRTPDLLTHLTASLSKEQYLRFKDFSLPGFQFGAPQVCPTFHLDEQWQLRASAYFLGVALLGRTDLFPTIDRISQVTTFKGSRAHTELAASFPHVDGDPDRFLLMAESKESPSALKKRKVAVSAQYASMQGLLYLAHTSEHAPGFCYVEGSHSPAFWQELQKNPDYAYLFTGRTSAPWRSITKIDRKRDPLGFSKPVYEGGKLVKLGDVPAGSYFVFDETCLHGLLGSRPGKGGFSRYGLYLGYSTHDNPLHSGYGTMENEVADRLRSALTGWSPLNFPSGAKTHAVQPKKFINFPSLVKKEHEKNGTPVQQRRGADGQLKWELSPLDPTQVFNYQPPARLQTPFYQFLLTGKGQ